MLYVSEAVRYAFWEALARNRFARRRSRELLRTKRGPVGGADRLDWTARHDRPAGRRAVRIGAPSAVAHDGKHAAGRALSTAVPAGVPEVEGFLYQSRLTGDGWVAVLDRAFGTLRLHAEAVLGPGDPGPGVSTHR